MDNVTSLKKLLQEYFEAVNQGFSLYRLQVNTTNQTEFARLQQARVENAHAQNELQERLMSTQQELADEIHGLEIELVYQPDRR